MAQESDADADLVPADIDGHLAHLQTRARDYAEKARADATKKAYRSDWTEFTAWADHRGVRSLPAEPGTVMYYIVELAGVAKTSTIGRRLVSIGEYHRAAGLASPTEDPTVQTVWTGIRNEHGTAPKVAEPISVPLLRAMIAKLPPGARGARDHALLLVGFAAALRRSELVALDLGDVVKRQQGLVVNIRRSKTDQEGAGRRVGVPTAPIRSPVQCVRSRRGARRVVSRRARSSSPLTGGAASPRTVSALQLFPASSGGRWLPPEPTPPPTPPTRFGRDLRRPPPRRVSRRGRSWRRPATGAWWSLGATSGKGRCSGRTLPPRWVCKPRRPATGATPPNG